MFKPFGVQLKLSISNYSPTNPRSAHKLGTTSASWKKIKLAAVELPLEPAGHGVEAESHGNGNGDGHVTNEKTVIEIGPNGEVAVWYRERKTLVVYDWDGKDCRRQPRGLSGNDLHGSITGTSNQTEHDNIQSGANLPQQSTPDLRDCVDQLLVRSWEHLETGEVRSMTFGSFDGWPILFCLVEDGGKAYLWDYNRVYQPLPAAFGVDLCVKASGSLVVVASAEGILLPCRFEGDRFMPICGDLRHRAVTLQPMEFYEHLSLNELANTFLSTHVCDGEPVFDLVGNWLAFSASKSDHAHKSPSARNATCNSELSATSSRTPVRIPKEGPMLPRVVSTISNVALDKLYNFSEMSTKTARNYWSKGERIVDKDISLHSISNSIGKVLNSTAKKLKLQISSSGSDYMKIVDLSNFATLANFKPPGGVSRISISPYDLQIVNSNLRGDTFYMWDVSKLPEEVMLVGTFPRGKTSAAVKEIMWFFSEPHDSVSCTNSGFGCITKKSGSVHWYNVNYLYSGKEQHNLPNSIGRTKPSSRDFADAWIMPSAFATKLARLPQASNIPANFDTSKPLTEKLISYLSKVNQLAYIDNSLTLRLSSPFNGGHSLKYEIPKTPPPGTNVADNNAASVAPLFRKLKCAMNRDDESPLSQAEIETSSPFLLLIADASVEFSTYTADNLDDIVGFLNPFGQEIPVDLVDFKSDKAPDGGDASKSKGQEVKSDIL